MGRDSDVDWGRVEDEGGNNGDTSGVRDASESNEGHHTEAGTVTITITNHSSPRSHSPQGSSPHMKYSPSVWFLLIDQSH
jgi:hypothetical protein